MDKPISDTRYLGEVDAGLESSTRLVNENKAKRSGHQYQKKHLKI
jgi:hypothetical protein